MSEANTYQREYYATLGEHYIENASTTFDVLSNAYYDNSLDIEKFKDAFKYIERSNTRDKFCFDLVNIDPPLANALRRIMLDEVPLMAADTVVFHNNTSIIPDEVLAHRIGLCPLDVDPHLFEFRGDSAVSSPITENNTLVFSLNISAPSVVDAAKTAKETGETLWFNVYAGDLQWVPIGSQAESEVFAKKPVKCLYPDILLAKLAPGQTIQAEIYCHKGTGRQHAKWSPVGTAFYSMKPFVTIQNVNDSIELECPRSREVENDKTPSGMISKKKFIEELKQCCPKNCFDKINNNDSLDDIEDINAKIDSDKCSLCRECFYRFPKNVKVQLNKKHFRFTVESASALTAKQVFLDALEILAQKAQEIIDNVDVNPNEDTETEVEEHIDSTAAAESSVKAESVDNEFEDEEDPKYENFEGQGELSDEQ